MYDKIVNPKTGRKVSIFNKTGYRILQKYILQTSLNTVVNILNKKLNDGERQNLIDKSINEFDSALKN